MRLLFLSLSLCYVCLFPTRAEETIDSRANYALALIDAAKDVDSRGYSRIAYPIYQDARNEWMQLHVWAPQWKPEAFDRTLDRVDKGLAETGRKMRGQAPPPEHGPALRDFENIAMITSKEPRSLKYRLEKLRELQKEFPHWEPDLVSDYIGQTMSEL